MGTPDPAPIAKMLNPAAVKKIAEGLKARGPNSHLSALESRVLINCYETQANTMKRLLGMAGTLGECTSCSAPVFWVRMRVSGKLNPFDPNGVSHFATCPKAAEHRKPKKKKPTKPAKPQQKPIDFRSKAAGDE